MYYNPKAMIFVLHLSDKKNIATVKTQLVEFFKKVESDDVFYLSELYEKPGLFVADLSSYKYDSKTSVYNKIKESVILVNQECVYHEKILYIIGDNIVEDYNFEKAINLAVKLGFKINKIYNNFERING